MKINVVQLAIEQYNYMWVIHQQYIVFANFLVLYRIYLMNIVKIIFQRIKRRMRKGKCAKLAGIITTILIGAVSIMIRHTVRFVLRIKLRRAENES